jgi:hypothetical protein
MDDVDTVLTCPLGSDCRKVNKEDGKVYQCRWFIQMKGKDTDGIPIDKWGCAMEWMPIVQTETTGVTLQMVASVQSMRNLQDLRQKEAIEAVQGITNAN